MIKLICVKDTKDWYHNTIYKGEIVLSSEYYDPFVDNISIWALQKSPNHIGYFRVIHFIPLDLWREQIIDKILN